MIDEEALDEIGHVLAGKLMMIVHIEDVRRGFLSPSFVDRDHDRLLAYGYERGSCVCLVIRGVISLDIWSERTAQKRSSLLSAH